MYQARFTRPISISLEDSIFQRLKALTDRERVSISHYVRYAVEQQLDKDEPVGEEQNNE